MPPQGQPSHPTLPAASLGLPALPQDALLTQDEILARRGSEVQQITLQGSAAWQAGPGATPQVADGTMSLSAAAGQASWAIYRFEYLIGADLPGVLSLTVAQPQPETLYLAMPDYGDGRWNVGAFHLSEAPAVLQVDQTALSPAGSVYVAVLVCGDAAIVESLTLNVDAVPAVRNLQASVGTYADRVVLTWDDQASDRYRVYCRIAGEQSAPLLLASVTDPAYGHSLDGRPGLECVYDVTYEYQVAAVVGELEGLRATSTGYRKLAAPDNFSASDGEYSGEVRCSWNAVPQASNYFVQHQAEQEWFNTGQTQELSLTQTLSPELQAGNPVWLYRVRASAAFHHSFGWEVVYSDYSVEDPGHPAHLVKAVLSASPVSGPLPLTVDFNAADSVGAEGQTIAQYEWDLDGDGTFELNSGSDPAVSREYTLPGLVSAQVRVTDTAANTSTDGQAVVPGGWAHTWGDDRYETAGSARGGPDGSTWFFGSAYLDPEMKDLERNIRFIRFDAQGNLVLVRDWYLADCSLRSADVGPEGCILMGNRGPDVGPNSIVAVAFTADGTLRWQRELTPVAPYANIQCCEVLADAQGATVAIDSTPETGRQYTLLLRLDNDGSLLWERRLQDAQQEACFAWDLDRDQLGRVIIGASVGPEPLAGGVLTVDAAGALLNQRLLIDSDPEVRLHVHSLDCRADGTLLLGAAREPTYYSFQPLLVCLSSTGQLLWGRDPDGYSRSGGVLWQADDSLLWGTARGSIHLDGAGNLLDAWDSAECGPGGQAADGAILLGGFTTAAHEWDLTAVDVELQPWAPAFRTGSVLSVPTAELSISEPAGTVSEPIGVLDTGGGSMDALCIYWPQ